MNRGMWVLAALALAVAVALGIGILNSGATPDVAAQGLCEYALGCDPFGGIEFLSYGLYDVEPAKIDGSCLVYEVAKTAPDGVASGVVRSDVSEGIIGFQTISPVYVCGNVINFETFPGP